MEKTKILKIVVGLLLCILVFELGVLAFVLRPGSFFLWVTLGVILIVCIYLAGICLKLINLLKSKIDKEE